MSMEILVYVKQVPDTDEIRFDPVTGNLDRSSVKSKMNPPDACAVEAALSMKDKYGAHVTAISMGPPQAEDVLKKALAMGCDESVLLSDRAFGGADTLATGYVLSEAARKIGSYDLLICGKCSADAETAQTGPIIAELLELPQATLVSDMELCGDRVHCRRRLSDRDELVSVALPALVSVLDDAFQPRYVKPAGIMKALKKPRHVLSAQELGCDCARAGAAGSPSINKSLFIPKRSAVDTRYFGGAAAEMAAAFADMLQAEKLI